MSRRGARQPPASRTPPLLFRSALLLQLAAIRGREAFQVVHARADVAADELAAGAAYGALVIPRARLGVVLLPVRVSYSLSLSVPG